MSLWIETRPAATAGQDLVLIHGWAMHSDIFAPLLDALAADFALHLVDLPGHGRSRDDGGSLDPGDCARRIAGQVPDGALWCGWSLGGLVALQAASELPHRVRGLVMLCASPRFVRAGDWPHGVSADVFQAFGAGLADDYRGTLERFMALEAYGSDRQREEMRLLRERIYAHGEPSRAALCDGLRVLETADLRAALPALAVSSLWIAGRRDRLVDPRAMRAAASLAPQGHFAQIGHGGHAPFLTHADEVARAILDFASALDRHSRESGNPATLDVPSCKEDTGFPLSRE